jgi:uncharacterized protein (TIGR02271 family)
MPGLSPGYDVHGRTLIDRDGDKIGDVDEVYEDQQGGQAEWALVASGLLKTKKTFVPLQGAEIDGENVRVPVQKEQVKDAPGIEADGDLSEDEERRLFEHYGMPYTDEGSTTATGTPGGAGGRDTTGRDTVGRDTDRDTVGHDTSGPTTDDAMTRSEEELRVGTQREERGRARLRKRVVTEHVQTTVPVQREEVHVEREPITEANRGDALDGPAISEEEHEVVLHEERPVVSTEAVPKERVRLSKDTVTDEETVGGEVRKEQIEQVEGDTTERRDR